MGEKKYIPKKVISEINFFFKNLELLAIKQPYLVVLILHEYLRSLYGLDAYIPFKEKNPIKRLDPAAIRGSILRTLTRAGKRMLPKISPTAPPRSPTPNPIPASAETRPRVNSPEDPSNPAPKRGEVDWPDFTRFW